MTQDAIQHVLPLQVAITGAAGQLAYSLIFRVASGEVFGPEQPIALRLLEIPPAMGALRGVAMELEDCAYPLLRSIDLEDDPTRGFDGVHWALLVGSKPRGKGMERQDLIRDNGAIFVKQGQALRRADAALQVLVVGNPANTNCLIARHHAPDVPSERFAAMMRLDQNRAMAQLAQKAGVEVRLVRQMTIWGNHSATQFPDFTNACIDGRPAEDVITDAEWLRGDFIRRVQQRGAAIIEARGLSSAASAANAAIDHICSLIHPTPEDDWFSAAVVSDGSYGVPKGLVASFPLRSDGRSWQIVQGLSLSSFARQKIDVSIAELEAERRIVADLLK